MITRDQNEADAIRTTKKVGTTGNKPAIFLWTIDGEKLSLSQAADYCDATYSPLHYAYKTAVKDGKTRFFCKGVEFSTEPVEPKAVESKKRERKVWTRCMTLLPGLCTHRLG